MQPTIHLNWLAILVAVVASFALGAIWYGPLFGKVWAKAMGFADTKPAGAEIAKGSIINIIGAFLMAFVLANNVLGWRPSAWGRGSDDAPYIYGFFAAFFSWLGFVVPILLNGPAFERKSWKVFAISAVYQLIAMIAMGMILSYWRA